MNVKEEDFPNLANLLASYFNQDYAHLHGSYEGTLRAAGEEPATYRAGVVAEIDRLVSGGHDETVLAGILQRFGVELSLPAFSRTPTQFLGELRARLS